VALLKALGYQFDKWELLYSARGQVFGASYTDVNAQLPALNLLIFISIVCAVILLVNVRFRGWILPAVAVGIWLVTSIGVGGIYPALVQRFSVEPNELTRETPFVQNNLDFTRFAFDLDDVEVRDFQASSELDAETIVANSPTGEINAQPPQLSPVSFWRNAASSGSGKSRPPARSGCRLSA
jgi:uncharacterized membrane protein (UPF0182 family)